MPPATARPALPPGGAAPPLAELAGAVAAGVSLQPGTIASVLTRATLLAGALDWHGAAARAFEDRLRVALAELRRAADLLDEAHALLSGYASTYAAGRDGPP